MVVLKCTLLLQPSAKILLSPHPFQQLELGCKIFASFTDEKWCLIIVICLFLITGEVAHLLSVWLFGFPFQWVVYCCPLLIFTLASFVFFFFVDQQAFLNMGDITLCSLVCRYVLPGYLCLNLLLPKVFHWHVVWVSWVLEYIWF